MYQSNLKKKYQHRRSSSVQIKTKVKGCNSTTVIIDQLETNQTLKLLQKCQNTLENQVILDQLNPQLSTNIEKGPKSNNNNIYKLTYPSLYVQIQTIKPNLPNILNTPQKYIPSNIRLKYHRNIHLKINNSINYHHLISNNWSYLDRIIEV